MSAPTAPIHLPPLTFLMSDHTTATLAIDVAEVLSSLNHTLYIDDFIAPVANGLQAMFDIDWARDMADPKQTNRLMLESIDGESTEHDMLVSLEKWFNENFGERQLGKMALNRMRVNRETFDYPYLFRDATPTHIQAFIADTSIPRRDMLIVNLLPTLPLALVGQVFNIQLLTWDTIPTIDKVVQSISEHCR